MQTTLMPTSSFFPQRLKELRLQAGLSQAALSELCGLGKDTVRQFENGRREPAFDTLVKLATGLGVSLAAFDPPEEEEKPAPRKRRRKE